MNTPKRSWTRIHYNAELGVCVYNPRVFAVRFFIRCDLRWILVPIVCGLSGGLAGCGPSSKLHLIQPQLAGWQRHMRLVSEQVYWAPGDRFDRVLAEFPLPGAATGRATFLLYLRMPAGESEPSVGAETGVTARGFFIQTRGVFAGLASVVGGHVQVRGTARGRGATRRIAFELVCEEGSRLDGQILARRDDYHIEQFETHRRPIDVEALVSSPPKPTTSDGP